MYQVASQSDWLFVFPNQACWNPTAGSGVILCSAGEHSSFPHLSLLNGKERRHSSETYAYSFCCLADKDHKLFGAGSVYFSVFGKRPVHTEHYYNPNYMHKTMLKRTLLRLQNQALKS